MARKTDPKAVPFPWLDQVDMSGQKPDGPLTLFTAQPATGVGTGVLLQFNRAPTPRELRHLWELVKDLGPELARCNEDA